jgi:hypothetical protein
MIFSHLKYCWKYPAADDSVEAGCLTHSLLARRERTHRLPLISDHNQMNRQQPTVCTISQTSKKENISATIFTFSLALSSGSAMHSNAVTSRSSCFHPSHKFIRCKADSTHLTSKSKDLYVRLASAPLNINVSATETRPRRQAL